MSVYYSTFQGDSVSSKLPLSLNTSITPSLSAAAAFFNFMIANPDLLNCLQDCAFPEKEIFNTQKSSLTILMNLPYFSNFRYKSLLEIIEYFLAHPTFSSAFGLIHLSQATLSDYFNLDDLILSAFTKRPEVIAVQRSFYDLKSFKETFEYFDSKLLVEGESYSLIAVAAKNCGVHQIALQGLEWIDLYRMGYSEKFRTWGKVFLAFYEEGFEAEMFFYKKKTGKVSRWIEDVDYICIENFLKTQKHEIWANNDYELITSKHLFSTERGKEMIDEEWIIQEYEKILPIFIEKKKTKPIEVEGAIEYFEKMDKKLNEVVENSGHTAEQNEEVSKTFQQNNLEEKEFFAKFIEDDEGNTKRFDDIKEHIENDHALFKDYNEISETKVNDSHGDEEFDATTKNIEENDLRVKEYDEAVEKDEKRANKHDEVEEYIENNNSILKETDKTEKTINESDSESES